MPFESRIYSSGHQTRKYFSKNKIFKLADFGLAGKIPDKNYFQGII